MGAKLGHGVGALKRGAGPPLQTMTTLLCSPLRNNHQYTATCSSTWIHWIHSNWKQTVKISSATSKWMDSLTEVPRGSILSHHHIQHFLLTTLLCSPLKNNHRYTATCSCTWIHWIHSNWKERVKIDSAISEWMDSLTEIPPCLVLCE